MFDSYSARKYDRDAPSIHETVLFFCFREAKSVCMQIHGHDQQFSHKFVNLIHTTRKIVKYLIYNMKKLRSYIKEDPKYIKHLLNLLLIPCLFRFNFL